MVYMKRGKSRIKRFISLLCCAAVICGGSPIHTKASFEDCWNMKLNSLTFYIQDKEETCTKLGKYTKSLNESPYVMAIPQHVKYTSGKEYKNIGIEDDVLKRQTFSMIYVQTGYGFSVGARAFQFVTVYYKQDMVTDMDVDFYSQDKSSVASKGVIEIGEKAFQGLQVPYGYMNIDKMNGSIGAYAFADAYIKEGLTIQEGLIDEVGPYAFKGLRGSKLILPNYRKLGNGAFQETKIKKCAISNKAEELGSQLFEGCELLEKIILPDTPGTMKKVAADTFPDQAGITIKVPAGYEDLSVYHFENYSNLKYELAPEYTEDSEVYKQLKELGAEVAIAEEVAETPSPSVSPEVTPAPTGSPVIGTDTPAPTGSPVIGTDTPAPTGSPVIGTDTPVSTESPVIGTGTLAPTESPVISTDTPAPTESPVAGTDTPAPTGSPVISTDTPAPTESPVVGTDTPAPTESPVVGTDTPVPTESPVIGTDTPAPTGSPVISTDTPVPTSGSVASPGGSGNPSAQTSARPSAVLPVKGTQLVVKGLKYKILGNHKVACMGSASQGKAVVSVPGTIQYQQVSYRVTQITPKAFYRDKKLRQLKLGKYVQEIGQSAFEQCTSLKKVSFGRDVTVIKKKAFYKDRNIIGLDFKGGRLKKVEKKAFSRGRQSKKVFVPSGVKKQKYYKLLQGSIAD